MERWQRQFIRYLFPYSASRMRIEAAFVVKHPHVPSLLYKYREFKASHMDALRRSVLYMSSPERFNDPFDTTVFFDPARFIIEDLPAKEFIEHVKEFDRSVSSGVLWRPKEIKNPVRQGDWIRQVILDPVHWFAVIPGRERSSRTRNPDTGSMFASGFRVRAFGAPRNDRTDYPDSV